MTSEVKRQSKKKDPVAPSGITIDIFSGDQPIWELNVFFPNNLCSGRMVRSFIATGLKEHSKMLGGKPVKLRLSDTSSLREHYWLEKGLGMTYFESIWDLKYDCMMNRFGSSSYEWFRNFGSNSGLAKAQFAFADDTFNPIRNAFNPVNPLIPFHDYFVEEIRKYVSGKSEVERNSMSIRQALYEFIPRWNRNAHYSHVQKMALAQNTFMYFYRHHPHFDYFARQVLRGYDVSCSVMTGTISNVSPDFHHFEFEFRLPE